MIPLNDTVKAQRFPIINSSLIVLNVAAFLFELSLGRNLTQFLFTFGLVPAQFWQSEGLVAWLPFFSSIFLHGGWMHLFSNMLALFIFGDNVEDRMGHGRYLFFYLLGGVLASLTHLLAYPDSTIPTVGASGAIAAVLGAYVVLYPMARVLTLIPIPIIFFFPIIEIPAILYLGFWFISQVFNGTFALVSNTFQGGGVAWWAHIGGFVVGLLLVKLLAQNDRRYHRQQQYYYLDDYQRRDRPNWW